MPFHHPPTLHPVNRAYQSMCHLRSPKEAETWHLGAHNATDDGAAVQPDTHLDGLAGHRVQDLAAFPQQSLDAIRRYRFLELLVMERNGMRMKGRVPTVFKPQRCKPHWSLSTCVKAMAHAQHIPPVELSRALGHPPTTGQY